MNAKTFYWLIPQHKYLLESIGINFPKKCNVLEVGSGRFSSVGLYFDSPKRKITLGCYDISDLNATNSRLQELDGHIQGSYLVKRENIFHLKGKYDIIIMKSVLGGLHRNDTNAVINMNKLLAKILNENITENGYLITIDNGKSIIARLVYKMGSRAKDWNFFTPSDFKNVYLQHSFGIVSLGSFVNKLYWFGNIADLCLYGFDKSLTFLKIRGAAQIISVFKNEPSA